MESRFHNKNKIFKYCPIVLAIVFLYVSPIMAKAVEPLTAAYNVGVAPLKFENEDGEDSGLLLDSWKIIAQKLGREIAFIKTQNFQASLDLVKKNQVDLHVGLFKTNEREKELRFTSPLFSVDYFIFSHPHFSAVSDLNALEGLLVGLTKGGFTERYIKDKLPESMLKIFDTYEDLFDAAVNGEIKAFVAQEYALLYYLNKRQLANFFQYKSKVPFYTQTYYSAVSRLHPSSQELVEQLNRAISQISLQETNKLKDKWFRTRTKDVPDDFLKKLSAEEKKFLTHKAIFTVQNEQDWAPFNFSEHGVPKGVTIDYLRLLGEKTGIGFRFISGRSWSEYLELAQKGRIDLVCNIAKSPNREREFSFTSLPYVSMEPNVYTRTGSPAVNDISDLFGKRVAVPKGFIHMELFEKYPEIEIVTVDTSTDAILALSRGKADALYDIESVASHIMENLRITNIQLGGEFQLEGAKEVASYCATAKENKVLASILDKAMHEVSAIDLETIRRKWNLGDHVLIQRTDERLFKELSWLGLTADEEEWLKTHKSIRVMGGQGTWPPFYLMKNNKPAGLAIDYVTTILEGLGLEIELIPMSWADSLSEIGEHGTIDLLPTISYSEKRDKIVLFTDHYLTFPYVVFNRKGADFTSSLEDLHGKIVAVEHGFLAAELLQRDDPEIQLLHVESTQEALEAVSLGQADGYIGNLAVGSYIIEDQGLTNVKIACPTRYKSNSQSIGVRKDWPELVSIINKYLSAMSDEQHSEIRKKAFAIRYEHGINRAYVTKVVLRSLAVFLIVVFAVLYWNRKLAKEIRERKRIQAELGKLSRVVEQSPIAVHISNREGIIEYANPFFSNVTGYDPDEVVGKKFGFLLSAKNPKYLLETFWETVNRGEIWKGEMINTIKSGEELWESVSVSPIFSPGGEITHFVTVKEDITERRRMMQEILEAKEIAESATRAKSDFLANMSHEIRTPMNAVMGMTHLALQTKLSRRQREYLGKIEKSAKSLLHVINDVLDFSKIEAGKLEIEATEFELDTLIDSIANILSVQVEEKGLELLFHVKPDVPSSLIGGALRINQILLNLIGNAIKFTQKGEIIVSINVLHQNEEKVDLKFAVQDTGIGLSINQQQKLFTSFSQADTSTTRRFGGTGLGLAISKNLVEIMGGEIGVQSELNHGSTFWFTLQLGKHEQEKSTQQKLLADDFRDMPVLVADDSKTSRDILEELLTSIGCKPDCVPSGHDALGKLNDPPDGEPYELVLMDCWMPEMDGLETIRRIREDHTLATLPAIIMVTAYGREEIMEQAEQVGVSGYLLKPVNQSLLFNCLMEVFGHDTDDGDSGQQSLVINNSELLTIKGANILLVEDNDINQDVAKGLLQSIGLHVTIAANGLEAVELTRKQEFACILMDIQMPLMDGFTATQKIIEELGENHPPIIAMTAHALPQDREKSLDAGMVDHINKPIHPQELYRVLLKWVAQVDQVPQIDTSLNDRVMENKTALMDLPGLTVQEGLMRAGGNQSHYFNLLKRFIDAHANAAAELRAGLNAQDIENSIMLAHTIKGVAGNIGAGDMAHTASQIEQSLREDPVSQFDQELVDQFQKEIERVVDSIGIILDEIEDSSVEAPPPDSLSLAQWVAEFHFLLSDDFSAAYKQIDILERMLTGKIEDQHIQELAKAVREFDTDAALTKTENIAELLQVDLGRS